MKLILSSCDFVNEKSKKVILENINKPLNDCKVLFIPNEKATIEKLNSNKYYKRLYDDGFENTNNIYVFNEYEVDKYRNLDIDLLYISGGNTFATLNKIRKCNFDKDIINYIKNGVIYIGGSCGAHIVSKSIKHLTDIDENYVNVKDYNGLGLFDGIIIPHYNELEFSPEKRKKLYDKLVKEDNYNIYTLTNSESLIVVDNIVIKK